MSSLSSVSPTSPFALSPPLPCCLESQAHKPDFFSYQRCACQADKSLQFQRPLTPVNAIWGARGLKVVTVNARGCVEKRRLRWQHKVSERGGSFGCYSSTSPPRILSLVCCAAPCALQQTTTRRPNGECCPRAAATTRAAAR